MDEKRYDVAAVKDRLNEYREKERDIDNQIERLERLVSKMTGAGAQVITDMPRSPSASGDRMAELIGHKEELETSIRKAVEEQSEERRRIEEILKRLRHSDERAVIRIRYFDRENWSIVAEVMFGGKDDFLGKEETYLRRVHKIHGSALLNMARIIEDGNQNPTFSAAM
jgi:hypothetical protein